MPINTDEKVVDANVLAEIYRASNNGCELLDWIIQGITGDFFVVDDQYTESPCNQYSHDCKILEDRVDFSDEDAITFLMTSSSHYERIAKDTWDIIITYYCLRSGAGVVSGDTGLLMICKESKVPHICFKALMYHLNMQEQIFELDGDGFYFGFLIDPKETNPFFSYLSNKNCLKCCGAECEVPTSLLCLPEQKWPKSSGNGYWTSWTIM